MLLASTIVPLALISGLDCEFARNLAQLQNQQFAAPVFAQAFQFPSPDALLTVESPYIFEVRDSDVGSNYFAALAAWHQGPNEDTAQALLDRLGTYTARLNALYLERGRSIVNWGWYLRAFVPGDRSRWGKVGAEAGIEIAKEIAGTVVLGIGLASLVGKLAAATYESFPTSARESLGPMLGIKNRVRIEAEEKATRVSQDTKVNATMDASFE